MKAYILIALLIGTWAWKNQIECPVIGIDLGVTHSRVCVYQNGNLEIIPNEQGNKLTSSFVAFTDDELLIDEATENQDAINPAKTLYEIISWMGRKYNDWKVQNDEKFMPYEISDKVTKPCIKVAKIKGHQTVQITRKEYSALILTKLKEISEIYFGKKVINAVVAVPDYFYNALREATENAGTIAGLKVVRILSEPVAAAIAYGFDKLDGWNNILVFDQKGSTLVISILNSYYGIEITTNEEDVQLGEKQFNERIIYHFIDVIKKKYNKDISTDKRGIQKLKREVEKATRALSVTLETTIEIADLVHGLNFNEILTRAKFEELNSDLFKKINDSIKNALEDSELKINEIDEIILVSNKIPKIRQIVEDFFNGKEAKTGINPDETFCKGAAIKGSFICSKEYNESTLLTSPDVYPLSLGIETVGDEIMKIIPKGSYLPTKKSHVFTTYQNQQQTVTISVFEGERPLVKDNHKLGTFDLTGISPNQRGSAQIEVTFEMDEHGILQVTAQDKETGNINQIVINNDCNRLLKMEIDKIRMEADEFAEQDQQKQMEDAKNSLNYHSMRNLIIDADKLVNVFQDDDKPTMKNTLKDSQACLDQNKNC